MCAEIFPVSYRDYGVMMTTTANWCGNCLLAQSFPMLLQHTSIASLFFTFALIAIGGLFLVKYFMPETKNIALEEIEENLLNNKPLKWIGECPKESV